MSADSKKHSELMIAALVHPRHTHLFERAMAKAGETSDVGARNFIHTCPASHGDRLVLELAYSCWRGYGPAIQVDQLWGMDAEVTKRALAGLALAMGAHDASALLRAAADRCDELTAEISEE